MTDLKQNKLRARLTLNGQLLSLDPAGEEQTPGLVWAVEETEDRFRLTLRAEEEVTLDSVGAEFLFSYGAGDRLF